MLVKAVANSTTANFIRVVGSEFVQKYLGEHSRSWYYRGLLADKFCRRRKALPYKEKR